MTTSNELRALLERVEGGMNAIRWSLFKALSAISWRVCPEPHKSRLQSVLPQWSEVEPRLRAKLAQEDGNA